MSKKVENVFKVVNAAKKPTILMSGYIGKYYGVNSDDLRKSVTKMEEEGVKECDILINSGGGSTIEGLTIGDFLANSSIKFNGIVVGMAASMAGGILVFCDTRSAYKNARVMTHKVQAGAWGEATALRSMADLADQEEEKIIAQFVEATGQTETTVKTWFKSGVDKWFTAKDCLKNGIIQTIITPPKKSNNTIDNSITNELELINAYQPIVNELLPTNEINLETNIMKKANILAALLTANIAHNLTANSTDEQFDQELQRVMALAAESESNKTKLDNFLKDTGASLVANAVKAGKIPANEKQQWMDDYVKNPDLVARAINGMTGMVNPNNGLETPTPSNDGDAEAHQLFKGREKWTFDEWQEKAPQDLQTLENEAPDQLEQLFTKQYK